MHRATRDFIRVSTLLALLGSCLAGCQSPQRTSGSPPAGRASESRRVAPPEQPPGGRAELSIDLGSGVRLDLVEIPAGELLIATAAAANGAPGPVHRVQLPAFYMGRCEVTQKQWRAVMDSNPSWYPADDLPVHRITWVDCHDFCERLAQRLGRPVRLPSEAEWEYACRAGTLSKFSFGDDAAAIAEYAWCTGTSGRRPNPVCGKQPNPWGLYDMHGNVWEWCEDLYVPDRTATPADGSPFNAGEPAGRRVLRGGSWFNPPEGVASDSRMGRPSHLKSAYIGFRVVIPAQPPADQAPARK